MVHKSAGLNPAVATRSLAECNVESRWVAKTALPMGLRVGANYSSEKACVRPPPVGHAFRKTWNTTRNI